MKKQQSPFFVLFTGFSGAGKSTLATAIEKRLIDANIAVYTLDGDVMRAGISKDLGFEPAARSENNRRVAEIGKMFIDAGLIVLAAFIAPYEKDRQRIKDTVGGDNYIEVFVNTSLKVCEHRDVKGLYKKAREGKIREMTGISAPYEIPKSPDIEVTENLSLPEAIDVVYNGIKQRLDL